MNRAKHPRQARLRHARAPDPWAVQGGPASLRSSAGLFFVCGRVFENPTAVSALTFAYLLPKSPEMPAIHTILAILVRKTAGHGIAGIARQLRQKSTICEECRKTNFLLENLAWENADRSASERFPSDPRTHISPIIVHRALFNMSRTLSRGNEGPSQENLSRLGPFYHHPMISSDRLCHQTDARIRSLIFAG